jgi:uncharacterized repeat protein (TIGR03803 family)
MKILFRLLLLMTALGLMLTGRVTAQTFTVLHSLTLDEGFNLFAPLVLSSNILYGAAQGGPGGISPNQNGNLFKLNTDGTGFTNLHTFTLNDGAFPDAALILSGSTLYGTTSEGGSEVFGTVFSINTDGTGFTTLHDFYGDGHGEPNGGLVLSSNTLYGTTRYGGTSGDGAVFAINTDGTGFTNLHTFTLIDGANPLDVLLISGNTLYGTTTTGGSSGNGTVFAVNTDGSSFTTLYGFTQFIADGTNAFGYSTNSDGANPIAGLVLSSTPFMGRQGMAAPRGMERWVVP